MAGTGVELVVADDATEEAAKWIAQAARAGGHVALSGGGTPRPAYERASTLAPDWSQVDLWLVDERVVPPGDGNSNYRLLNESLLDGLARSPRIHRVHTELAPEEAAAAYDAELGGVTLDLALLGIGSDGHTASLFPNAPALEVRDRRAVAAEAGMEPFVPRVTLTVPMVEAAALAVFLVTGENKADVVARAFSGEPSADTPASLVRGKRTVAILDRGAASKLNP